MMSEIVVEAVTKENKVCPFLRSKNILSVVNVCNSFLFLMLSFELSMNFLFMMLKTG